MDELRAFIERLSCLDRASCSPGEAEAAELIAGSLRDAGARAEVERSWAHGTYWWPLGLTSASGIPACWTTSGGHRALGGALGLLGVLAAADELVAGRRQLRRRLPQRVLSNVVARTDGYIAMPHGLASAMIMSIEDHGAASDYHWHTDTAKNVNYTTLRGAVVLAERVTRTIAAA